MASDVQIVNAALVNLGHEPIQSLLDESDQARAANAVYDICRDDALAAYPWNFATKRFQLAELVITLNTDEWAKAYQEPVDCLRVLYIEPKGTRFRVEEGGRILTNQGGPIKGAYIARVTDTTRYSPSFIQAFVYRLDMDLSTALTARDGYKKDFAALFQGAIRDAKSTDAQEGSGVIEDWSPLADVRLVGMTNGFDWSGWPYDTP